MKTRRLRFAFIACVLLALTGGLVWRFEVGPGRMVAAIQRGDLQKIDLFSRLGIRPNSDAFLVGGFMHCAAANGRTQAMAKLQDLGASVNRLDGYGVSPVHVAIRFHQIESLSWLLSHGADPSIRDRDGRTAADYVVSEVSGQQQEEFVSALKPSKSQFDFSGGDGSSPTEEVFINARSWPEVQAAQTAWLSEKFPGLHVQRSGFVAGMGGRDHETIQVITADRLTNRVYFAYPQRFP